MRILSMTATFGKLENQPLTLQPGMNIIHAPNEWGKSTWCAFLVAMLYGVESREKNTKTTLTVKERYTPWSGSPMSGRIDLEWNGRYITLERRNKGRTILGDFRAFETESGLPVPELTGTNCGEMLLGVEKNVFLRAGFLRLNDLPVTEDEALRRRLNALVTTGDESGSADLLGQKLRALKNKCRSNRTTGLIPQAEAQKKELEDKLAALRSLNQQSEDIRQRQRQLEEWISTLENHKAHLAYKNAAENLRRVAEAEENARFAQRQRAMLEEKCQALPDPEKAKQKLHTLQDLWQKQQNARLDAQMMPPPPQEPKAPLCFYGLSGTEALAQVRGHIADYRSLSVPSKKPFPLWLPGALGLLVGMVLLVLKLWLPGILLLAAGTSLLIVQAILMRRHHRATLEQLSKQRAIAERYGGGTPDDWLALAQQFLQQQQEYDNALRHHAAARQQAADTIAQLDRALEQAGESMGLSAAMEHFTAAIKAHEALADARRTEQQAQTHAETLRSVTKPVPPPEQPDNLTFSLEETLRRLSEATAELKQLQLQLGQHQGRMDSFGSEQALQSALDRVRERLASLNQTNEALELALQTLESATAQLQRRFAPRIAESTRNIFGKLTGGRYTRLNLTQELAVETATAQDVNTLPIIRRSDGTIDQLYFALRLAVSRELTPEAPLILDDALVRFDDTRHRLAIDILRQEAESKQIILFTCQSRETEA